MPGLPGRGDMCGQALASGGGLPAHEPSHMHVAQAFWPGVASCESLGHRVLKDTRQFRETSEPCLSQPCA